MNRTHRIIVLTVAVLTVGTASVTAQRGRRSPAYDTSMSGTYELQRTQSTDTRRAVTDATRSLPAAQRDRAYQTLLGRLEPPQMYSLDRDRNGRTVTIASSRGARLVFDADGSTAHEFGQNGRAVSTRAQIVGNQLIVSSTGGGRGSDFSVTFESISNGDRLRVTRRLDDDGLARPVTVQSYYQRTSATPRWDVYGPGAGAYRGGDRSAPEFGRGRQENDTPQDGARLVAILDTALSMRGWRTGDPFSMTVRGPGSFQGARIDGVVSRVNEYGASNSSDNMRVDFRTISFGGRTSDFSALIDSVRLPNGTEVSMDDEGGLQRDGGGNTVRNGAIGGALGAIIGAVVGGGKGAVVGAAAGGVGGVIVSHGQEQLDLARGSEITLTVVDPATAQYR